MITNTHNSGNVRNKRLPNANPNGKIKSVLDTPNLLKTLFVKNN